MADIVVLSDYPAFDDAKRNMTDNMGRYTWHLLHCSNATRYDIAVEFIYDTYQDMNYGRSKLASIEAKHKPKVIIAMGQRAMNDLGIDGKISKIRGSVFELERKRGVMHVIPTYSQRDLKKPDRMYTEDSLEKGVYALHDFQKAVTILKNGWRKPPENFNLNPTVEDVEKFVDDAIKYQWLLGTDIEATGLNIELAQIVVLGFAWSESDAIVIPFLKYGGEEYWSRKDWNRVLSALTRLFANGNFMFQNGVGYDVPLLLKRGWKFPLKSFKMDTMVKHHAINPESPHNIGFISSIYGKQPYWKEVMKDFWGEKILIADQEEMKLYNARDCVALHQINNGMQDYIEELIENEPIFKDTNAIIEKSMSEARAVIRMETSGILLDKSRFREWIKYLKEEIDKLEAEIRTDHKLPGAFSLTSSDHKRFWLYNEKTMSLNKEKLEKEMSFYEAEGFNYQYECSHCQRKKVKKFYPSLEEVPKSLIIKCTGKDGCNRERRHALTDKAPSKLKQKDKDTNVYRKLLGDYELSQMEPLYQLKNYKPLKSQKTNKSLLDKGAIVRYQIHINDRLDEIAGLRRRRPVHDEEEQNLKSLMDSLEQLKKYIKLKTLQSNFTNFKTRADGKVYPNFMVTGTATGRLSCKDPNL